MTAQKTRSLTLPSNPVARLRELADLDAAVPSVRRLTDDSNAATLQHRHNGSQQPFSAEASPRESADTHVNSNRNTPAHDSAATQPHSGSPAKRRNNDPSRPEVVDNPVRQAMRQALLQSYSADLNRGPSTATTIRIPTEIWERLDMAATLKNQTKQEIIAEALKQHLKKIGRGEV